MTHVRELMTLSKTDDWHSPLEFVEAGRYTLGGRIHRDPASCILANTMLVKAEHIYTEIDDGLEQPWDVPDDSGVEGARMAANVWHNPPSSADSADMVADWYIKLMREILAGRVRACVFFAFRAAAISSMAYQAARAGLPGPHTMWRCEPGRVKFLRPRKLEGIIEVVQEVPKDGDNAKKPKKSRKGQERFVHPLPGFELPVVQHDLPLVGATIDDVYERGEQPMHDSALLCMGPDDVIERFKTSFAPLGHVMPPEWRP